MTTLDAHPVIAVAEFLGGTVPGRILLALLVLLVACVFSPHPRRVVGLLWRLLTGGLVLRRPGPWDSTFDRSAPDRPEARPNFRGERYPRTRWARIPGYQRMFWRWAATGALYALITWPVPVLLVAAVLGLLALLRAVFRLIQDWAYDRSVGSFAVGVAILLGEKRNPSEYIALPRLRVTMVPIAVDERITRAVRRWPALERLLGKLAVPMLRIPLEADDAKVLVQLDAKLTSEAVVTEVRKLGEARLPEGPWVGAHHAANLQVELKHPRRPPPACWYDVDVSRQFTVDEIPIGMRAGDKGPEWVKLPLKALTPHGTMSATTGWCKTTTANVMVAHMAGCGALVLINDPKRVGYTHFDGLPNVIIRTTVQGWAHTNAWLLGEMERRYALIEQFPEIKDNPEAYFQPIFVLNDERGSYVADLKDWAKEQGEKGIPLPLRQEKKILWQGRAAAIYIADLCQQANLSIFIDSDGRDQRMWRIASGPQTRSAWFMLFAGIAKKSMAVKKGRAMLGIGVDKVEEITLARVSDADARSFAEAGQAIAERENNARIKRIQALLRTSVPAQDSYTPPGEITSGVPGQSQDTGTVPGSEESNGSFSDGVSAGNSENGGNSTPSTANDGSQNVPDHNVWGVPNQDTSNARRNDEAADENHKVIVGIKAAADFLEMSEEAFIKARKRRNIRGEKRVGIQPAWSALDLREWRSQAPRAGAS